MANPQQPELRRSEENLRPRPDQGPDPHDVGGETGPIPADNQPGHHPEHEQDKPPADKFAAALGIKPDTEVGSETPPPARRSKTKDADDTEQTDARSESGDQSRSSDRSESGDDPHSGARSGTDDQAEDAADGSPTDTSVPPIIMPATTAAATTFQAGSGPADPEPSPFPGPDAGGAAAAATMIANAPSPDEPAERAAALHHHTLPDHRLPHATGIVTPAGTPVTGRAAMLWPLQLWGMALRTTGDAICAYGRVVRKIGERLAPDQD